MWLCVGFIRLIEVYMYVYSEDVRSANIICNENDTHCLVVDRE